MKSKQGFTSSLMKLSDVCQIFSGGTPSTKNHEYWNGDIPWLSSGETRNNFIEDTERKITEKGVKNSSTRLAKKEDIVVASAGQGGTRGQVSFCLIDTYVNQSLIVLRPKREILLPKFLFYNLKSRYQELRQFSDSHSSRGSLPKNVISTIEIMFPSISVQDKISKYLFDLDFQIENLKNQNQILEQIIQSIFKSWFVDFDGQIEFVDSELGEIPKGWKIEKLGNVLSLLKDGSHNPPQRVENGVRFIAGASDVKHFEIDFSNCTYITKDDYDKIHKYYTIATNDILLTIVGTIGNVAIVKEDDLPFSLQRSIAIHRPNEMINYSFLYCMLNFHSFKQFLYASVNPTGQPGIYLGALSEFKFVLPTKLILDKFETISEPIIKIMQNNNHKIKILVKTRDSLLPKLMSGEIRV